MPLGGGVTTEVTAALAAATDVEAWFHPIPAPGAAADAVVAAPNTGAAASAAISTARTIFDMTGPQINF
jgi:hypothetical protein